MESSGIAVLGGSTLRVWRGTVAKDYRRLIRLLSMSKRRTMASWARSSYVSDLTVPLFLAVLVTSSAGLTVQTQAGSSKIPVGQIIAVLAEEGEDLASLEIPKDLSPPGASESAPEAPKAKEEKQAEEPKQEKRVEAKPESASAPAGGSHHGHKEIKHSKPIFPSVSRLYVLSLYLSIYESSAPTMPAGTKGWIGAREERGMPRTDHQVDRVRPNLGANLKAQGHRPKWYAHQGRCPRCHWPAAEPVRIGRKAQYGFDGT